MGKQKTNKDFLQQVHELIGDEYTFLEEYKKGNIRIKVRHNCSKCNNYEYEVAPSNFLIGNRCPKCAGVMKKTDEQFKEEVYNQVGNEYTFLEKYNGARTKIMVRHNCNECNNNEYAITPDNFLSKKHRCPVCLSKSSSKKRRKSHEKFLSQVFLIIGDKINNFEFLNRYVTCKIKLKIKCKLDNFVWEILPEDFINTGCKCPKCSNSIGTRTEEYFKQEIFELVENEYTVLGKYINTQTKILMRHNNCKKEYMVKPNDFLMGQRCPKCQHQSYKKTDNEFKQEVNNLVGEEYKVIGKYERANKKILIKHLICNHEYEITPNDFLNGIRCPICNESKGEQFIRNYCKKNNIFYHIQYNFYGCRDKRMLPFDFALFYDKEETELKFLIEYDGEFHYKAIRMNKNEPKELAETRLIKQQNHDEIKNKYCRDKKIELLRIPYWEFINIERILEVELNLYKDNLFKDEIINIINIPTETVNI